MHSQFHALLVEGTTGVGKSTLIDALIRKHVWSAPPRKIRSFTHLAQTHTYGPLALAEDDGTLSVEKNRAHLERIVGMLEFLHDAHAYSPIPSFAIIDTLHLTQCCRPGVVSWRDVEPYDDRLAAIGCKLIVLSAQNDTLRARSIEARVGSQFLEVYASKFGSTHDGILAYFISEQATILNLFASSKMCSRELSADSDFETTVAGALSFWRS